MAAYDTIDDDPYRQPSGGYTMPGAPVPQQTPSAPAPTPDLRGGIASAYQDFLKRAPKEEEYGFWLGNPNYRAEIQASPEAKSIAGGQQPGTYFNAGAALPGFDQAKWSNPQHQTDKYTAGRLMAAGGSIDQVLQALPGWKKISNDVIEAQDGTRIDLTRDFGGANQPQWTEIFAAPGSQRATSQTAQGWGQTFGAAGAPGVSGTQNVFGDPATQEWERLLRSLVDRLNQPRPLGYTPSQQELIATQALDPLERQRQDRKRQVMLQMSARGHSQNSGPLQMALNDIDRQFDALSAQARAGFAMNQIGLEDQRFNQNEQRAMTGVNTMFQLPQLADARFNQYANFIQGTNTGQGLLGLMMNQNNFNQQQNAAYWSQLIAALMNAAG